MVDASSRFARDILGVLYEHEKSRCSGDDYDHLRRAIEAKVREQFPHLDVDAILHGKRVHIYMEKGGVRAYAFHNGCRMGFSAARRAARYDPVTAGELVQALRDAQPDPTIAYGVTGAP